MKKSVELFRDLTHVHPFVEYEYIEENQDVVINFDDKNFPMTVTIRLKNYNLHEVD